MVLWSKENTPLNQWVGDDSLYLEPINNVQEIAWSSTKSNISPDFSKISSKVFHLNSQANLPFKNLYETPETLGQDRIAAATGALFLYPQQNTIIIDAGTCITVDFISESAEYHGGSISPGIQMRYRALHEFTGKLPLVNSAEQAPMLGKSTVQSIQSGVWLGVLAELNDRIDQISEKWPNTVVVITGGDAQILGNHLKSRIFAQPLLNHYGLLHCLKFNEF